MENLTGIGNKIIILIKVFVLLLCTAVSGYGILNAPESEQTKLEQELRHNEQILQQTNSAFQVKASALKRKDGKTERRITVIGDSVFLGAAPSFAKIQKNVIVDAKVSRQVRHGLEIAKKLNKKKKLGDTVIIALGTNGVFNSATGQALIDYLGTDRTIYWINAYGKNLGCQRDVNKTIQKLAKKNDNVSVISWAKEGKKHPDWFYQDGIHLNPTGQIGYARFIKKKIS